MNMSQNRYRTLTDHLQKMKNVAIAFSGGLDSRFLAFMAQMAQANILLFHVHGSHVAKSETAKAMAWARQKGIECVGVEVNVLSENRITQNDRQRCYYCKHYIFSAISKTLEETARTSHLPYVLCDGTNADDLSMFRPGLKALREQNIISPLAECGIGKQDIHNAGTLLGFDNPFQPAKPCLLTRFPYETSPTLTQLKVLDTAETIIEDILAASFSTSEADSVSGCPPAFRLRFVRADNEVDAGPTASGGTTPQNSCPGHSAPKAACTNGSYAISAAGVEHSARHGSPLYDGTDTLPGTPLRLELHVNAVLPAPLCETVFLELAGQGIELSSISVMKSLSGYFDRQ